MSLSISKETFEVIFYGTTIIIVALPFIGKVSITSKKWHRKISRFGWCIIILSLFNLRINQKINDITDKRNKSTLDSNASHYENLIRDLVSTNLQTQEKSKNEIILTLAKDYNLVYDSTRLQFLRSQAESKKVINRLVKDSSLRQAKYISTNRPSLSVSRVERIKYTIDSVIIQVKLLCSNSTAYNLNLPIIFGYFNKGTFTKLGRNNDFDNADLSAGDERTATLSLSRVEGHNEIFIYIKGNFEDIPQFKLTFPYERLYIYDIVQKKLGAFSADKNTPYYKGLNDYLNKN
jgi:hypothetical protein